MTVDEAIIILTGNYSGDDEMAQDVINAILEVPKVEYVSPLQQIVSHF